MIHSHDVSACHTLHTRHNDSLGPWAWLRPHRPIQHVARIDCNPVTWIPPRCGMGLGDAAVYTTRLHQSQNSKSILHSTVQAWCCISTETINACVQYPLQLSSSANRLASSANQSEANPPRMRVGRQKAKKQKKMVSPRSVHPVHTQPAPTGLSLASRSIKVKH
jgi:hypothetical protein